MATQTTLDLPARDVVDDARRMFAKTLASWAQDLLVARSQGVLTMNWQCEASDREDRWSLAA